MTETHATDGSNSEKKTGNISSLTIRVKSRSIGYRQGSGEMLIVRHGIVSFGIPSIDLTITQMFSVVN